MSTQAPVAKPPTAPGPVEPSVTRHFPSRDGTSLYGEWFPVESPRACALIVHGYLEHCGRYREVAHVLNRAGLSVFSFDMRGHGRANGQRGYITGITDYLDDVRAAFEQMIEHSAETSGNEHLPNLLVGHSNGGLLILRTLADPTRELPGVRAAVVSSPFLGFKIRVPTAQKLLARATSRWIPKLSLPSKISIEWLTSDPDKQQERRLDTLCHDVSSARWYTSTVEAHAYVADYAARVQLPTCWLVAGRDQLADPVITRMVQARMRPPSVYHDLNDMQHEVFNERERARVFNLMTAFIDEHYARR